MDWEICCNLGSPLRPFSSANILCGYVCSLPPKTDFIYSWSVRSRVKVWKYLLMLQLQCNAIQGYFPFLWANIYYYCPSATKRHSTPPQLHSNTHLHAIFLCYHRTHARPTFSISTSNLFLFYFISSCWPIIKKFTGRNFVWQMPLPSYNTWHTVDSITHDNV